MLTTAVKNKRGFPKTRKCNKPVAGLGRVDKANGCFFSEVRWLARLTFYGKFRTICSTGQFTFGAQAPRKERELTMQNKLRVIRAELGMSQEDLARLSGLSRATVNRVERGLHIPSGSTMMKLSRALRRPATSIFLSLAAV